MPLITRRSSTRGLPGRPRGRCGSTTAQAASESQNRRAITISCVSEPNQKVKTQATAKGCMGSLLRPSGSERASWNFDFSVNTGIGGSTKTLEHFDLRIVIESGDGERGVFNLQHDAPGVTPWNQAGGPGVINDDDGPGPGDVAGGSPQISQNSVNLGFNFMQGIF